MADGVESCRAKTSPNTQILCFRRDHPICTPKLYPQENTLIRPALWLGQDCKDLPPASRTTEPIIRSAFRGRGPITPCYGVHTSSSPTTQLIISRPLMMMMVLLYLHIHLWKHVLSAQWCRMHHGVSHRPTINLLGELIRCCDNEMVRPSTMHANSISLLHVSTFHA